MESLASRLGRVGLSMVLALFTQLIVYFVGEAVLLSGRSPRTFAFMAIAVTPSGGTAVFGALVLLWYGVLRLLRR